MKNVKLIVLSHYDFKNSNGEQIKGSKVALTSNGKNKLEMSTKSEEVFALDVLTSYQCDLFINEDLKIDITNVRK